MSGHSNEKSKRAGSMKKDAELEQAIASFRDMVPRSWWSLYHGCMNQGFNETESFDLLKTYILSSHSGGINPHSGNGPKPEDENYTPET